VGHGHGESGALTISDTKSGAGSHVVVFEFVIDEAKDGHQELEKDPDNEEDTPAALIHHPAFPFPAHSGFFVDHCAVGEVGSHEPLEPPALCLITLEVSGTIIGVYDDVRVVNFRSSVRKIESRGAFSSHASWR
jgi:hypothetical protein